MLSRMFAVSIEPRNFASTVSCPDSVSGSARTARSAATRNIGRRRESVAGMRFSGPILLPTKADLKVRTTSDKATSDKADVKSVLHSLFLTKRSTGIEARRACRGNRRGRQTPCDDDQQTRGVGHRIEQVNDVAD